MHLALVAGACAKAQAKANLEGPPLAVPAPPPRVLAPVEGTLAEDTPPAPEQPIAQPAGNDRPTNARPATAPRNRPTTTAAAPSPTTEPAPDASAATPPATEPPAVRPVPAQDTAAENRVREVMRKAANDLKGVDYRKLNAAGQGQYTQSQKFGEEAEKALKERNYTLAAALAEKAATVASELLGATR